MSKFIMEYDEANSPQSVTLVLRSVESFENLVDKLQEYKFNKYIDLTLLDVNAAWKIINDFACNQRSIVILLLDSQVNEELLKSVRNLEDINFKDDVYHFKFGEENIDLIKKYKILSLNVKYKNKSYELEIVESLLMEHDKNNEIISQLKRENQQLQHYSRNIGDDELETRYLELMEKYKQSLKRLDQLRNSKLGKLQVAYWNQKRGY